MTRRVAWSIVAILVVLVAAAQVAYWKVAADQLKAGYRSWMTARIAEGWDVGSGPLSIGGWPRAATLTVPDLTLRHAGPTIPGTLDVAAADVMLSVSLFEPTHLRLSISGPTHVRAGGIPDIIVTGDQTAMSVPLGARSSKGAPASEVNRPVRQPGPEHDRVNLTPSRSDQAGPRPVVLQARGLRIEAATGAWHVSIGLLNAQAEASAADQAPAAAVFRVSSEAIALPGTIRWPLGRNISSLAVDGKVRGPFPTQSGITGWARRWRDRGGALDIARLTMGWGPLGLTGSATLALDDQLQPMGSGNGRFVGYDKALDKLAEDGVLSRSAATVAKAVLSLIAGADDNERATTVDVPLTLQYRTLSMRQVPLLRLPELDWPAQ